MAAHLHLAPGQADEGTLVEGNLPQLGGLPGEGLQLLGHGSVSGSGVVEV